MSHSCSLELTIRIVFGQEDVFHLFCPWILVWDQITGDRRSPTQRSTIIFCQGPTWFWKYFHQLVPRQWQKMGCVVHAQKPKALNYLHWLMRLYCSIIIWQEGQYMKIVRCFSHLKICTKGLTRILLGAFTLLSGTEYLVHWSGSSCFHTCQFGLDFSGKLRSPD